MAVVGTLLDPCLMHYHMMIPVSSGLNDSLDTVLKQVSNKYIYVCLFGTRLRALQV